MENIIREKKANKYNYLYLLMGGHMCADINQGAIPAIMTFLVLEKNFDLAAASGLVFASNFLSSIIQPLIGRYADQKPRPWIMSLGIFFAGLGLAVIGFLENYWTIILCATISGIGISLFHPEGGRLANCIAGNKKGQGMSIFAVGGTLGFAIGPMIATAGLLTFGIKGTWVLIIPSLLMSIILLAKNREFISFSCEAKQEMLESKEAKPIDNWRGFSILTLAVFGRSIISYGLNTFIPLYWVMILMQSEVVGNARLTMISLIGVIANIIGGRMADRYGFKKVIHIQFFCLTPLILLLSIATNNWLATLLLIPIGLTLNGAYTPMITLGQKFLPNQIGLASGVMMGLAGSFGGIMAPVLGKIGDTYGMSRSILVLSMIAAVTTLIIFFIPKPESWQSQIQQEKVNLVR